MTDKKLNELRDKLKWSAWEKVVVEIKFNDDFTPTRQLYHDSGFDKGFDAAIKALRDNYVEKDKVEKLTKTVKEALNDNLEYARECRRDWSDYDGRTHLSVASSVNKKVIQAIAEFEGEK